MLALFRLLLLSFALFGVTVAVAADFVDQTRDACVEVCGQGGAGDLAEHLEPQADSENIPLMLAPPCLVLEAPAGLPGWAPSAAVDHIPPPSTPPPRRG